MNDGQFQTDVYPMLRSCRAILAELAQQPGMTKSIVLIENEGLYEKVLYGFQRVIRKLPKDGGIDLILDSHGGSIDIASSIAGLCRARFGSFRVIAPFMVKSAAALVVLEADERILTFSTQLGPVDPQVRHPQTRMLFPAHSIKDAIEQVEGTKDPLVKVALADKLDPLLMGAYKDAMNASKQYIEEAVERWSAPNAAEIVSAFTDKYKSHGYPIDRATLDDLKVPYTAASDEVERLVCDLHELCDDIITISDDEEATIIMAANDYIFMSGDYRKAAAFDAEEPSGPTDGAEAEAVIASSPNEPAPLS